MSGRRYVKSDSHPSTSAGTSHSLSELRVSKGLDYNPGQARQAIRTASAPDRTIDRVSGQAGQQMPIKISILKRLWVLLRLGYDPMFEDSYKKLERIEQDLRRMDDDRSRYH